MCLNGLMFSVENTIEMVDDGRSNTRVDTLVSELGFSMLFRVPVEDLAILVEQIIQSLFQFEKANYRLFPTKSYGAPRELMSAGEWSWLETAAPGERGCTGQGKSRRN